MSTYVTVNPKPITLQNSEVNIYLYVVVFQWDLVCDDSWMASFAYTVIGLGQLIGATFWGALSDRSAMIRVRRAYGLH